MKVKLIAYILLLESLLLGVVIMLGIISDPALAVRQNTPKRSNTDATQLHLAFQETAAEQSVRIQFFGDLMLDRRVAERIVKNGLSRLFGAPSSSLDSMFGTSTFRIANLEGPFAEKRVLTLKEIAFRFDPGLAPQLKDSGFTAFNLANNHSYDMGRQNVKFTRSLLENNGLGWFGDELSEATGTIWFASSSGIRFALIGVHATYHKPDLYTLSSTLAYARTVSDHIIVNVHWGDEYKNISNKKQRELAHFFIDNGADLVIGHHPHVTEEAEIYKEKPIFYSLGNFIFDQYFSEETQQGLAVNAVFKKTGLTGIKLVPYRSVRSQIQLMDSSTERSFFSELSKNSRLGDKIITGGEITF